MHYFAGFETNNRPCVCSAGAWRCGDLNGQRSFWRVFAHFGRFASGDCGATVFEIRGRWIISYRAPELEDPLYRRWCMPVITQVRGGTTPLTLSSDLPTSLSTIVAFHYYIMLYHLGNQNVTFRVFRPNTNLLSIITNRGYDTRKNLNATRKSWGHALPFRYLSGSTDGPYHNFQYATDTIIKIN